MQDCWDPIMNVVIPLTILNLLGTTLVVICSRYVDRFLFTDSIDVSRNLSLPTLRENIAISKDSRSNKLSAHNIQEQPSIEESNKLSTHNIQEQPSIEESNKLSTHNIQEQPSIEESNKLSTHNIREQPSIEESNTETESISEDSKDDLQFDNSNESVSEDSKDDLQFDNSNESVSTEEDNEELPRENVEHETSEERYQHEINDDDIIASVRESSVLSVVNADNSPKSRKEQQNLQEVQSKAEITRNELSSEQASLESMAGTLISVTKKIAGTLDTADHIPKDKKKELADILKGVPEFITKIVDMDDDELGSILNCKIVSPNKTASPTEENKNDSARKESEYLMQTLEALKSKSNTSSAV